MVDGYLSMSRTTSPLPSPLSLAQHQLQTLQGHYQELESQTILAAHWGKCLLQQNQHFQQEQHQVQEQLAQQQVLLQEQEKMLEEERQRQAQLRGKLQQKSYAWVQLEQDYEVLVGYTSTSDVVEHTRMMIMVVCIISW